MKHTTALLFLLPLFASAQIQLSVFIEGVKSSAGNINVAVYNHADGFLKMDRVYKSGHTRAIKGITHLFIDDLPEGEYALAVFHDENSNNILDTNWLGVPREAYGFSKGRVKMFGPPSFGECAMKISANSEIRIGL
jgi:uncharacterized protein (DUF2141 family)